MKSFASSLLLIAATSAINLQTESYMPSGFWSIFGGDHGNHGHHGHHGNHGHHGHHGRGRSYRSHVNRPSHSSRHHGYTQAPQKAEDCVGDACHIDFEAHKQQFKAHDPNFNQWNSDFSDMTQFKPAIEIPNFRHMVPNDPINQSTKVPKKRKEDLINQFGFEYIKHEEPEEVEEEQEEQEQQDQHEQPVEAEKYKKPHAYRYRPSDAPPAPHKKYGDEGDAEVCNPWGDCETDEIEKEDENLNFEVDIENEHDDHEVDVENAYDDHEVDVENEHDDHEVEEDVDDIENDIEEEEDIEDNEVEGDIEVEKDFENYDSKKDYSHGFNPWAFDQNETDDKEEGSTIEPIYGKDESEDDEADEDDEDEEDDQSSHYHHFAGPSQPPIYGPPASPFPDFFNSFW